MVTTPQRLSDWKALTCYCLKYVKCICLCFGAAFWKNCSRSPSPSTARDVICYDCTLRVPTHHLTRATEGFLWRNKTHQTHTVRGFLSFKRPTSVTSDHQMNYFKSSAHFESILFEVRMMMGTMMLESNLRPCQALFPSPPSREIFCLPRRRRVADMIWTWRDTHTHDV